MSIPLPIVDLSSFPVGSKGSVSFSNAGPLSSVVQYKTPAHIQVYNESGSGLQITFVQGGDGYVVPAGGWLTLPLAVGESGYTFTVLYTLPNPPVTQLISIYYAPGETVPSIAILGNSPIGIGGTIQTSSVQELVNQGQAPLTPIINVQPNNTAGATWTADNSGNLMIKADTVGTLITLLQLMVGTANGTPSVSLSDANHLVEVLGGLKVDGTSFVGTTQIFGPLQLQAGSAIQFLAGTLTRYQIFQTNGGGTITFTHNWNSIPDYGFAFYRAGATPFGTAPNVVPYVYNMTATQATFQGEIGYNASVLLIGL